MEINNVHRWDLSTKEAINLQNKLSDKIITNDLHPDIDDISYVAGCDISFNRNSKRGYAVVVILSYPDFEIVDKSFYVADALMPYIPGLLSFREAPLLLEAFKKINTIPDIVMYDGQGYAHPRRMGLATHMGIITGIPSIGCAKSLFVGDYDALINPEKGEYSELIHNGEKIGCVLYTRKSCKPVFVSVGHKVSLNFALEFTLSCSLKYKIPEPTRRAHLLSNDLRKSYL